jgi:hypothetical protein
LRIQVNRSGRKLLCHKCGSRIERGERYVRTGGGSYHTVHYQDSKGRPMLEPTTDLERSRAAIPLKLELAR